MQNSLVTEAPVVMGGKSRCDKGASHGESPREEELNGSQNDENTKEGLRDQGPLNPRKPNSGYLILWYSSRGHKSRSYIGY